MERTGRPRLLQRGGAHNRRNRESWQLSERDCRKLIGASEAAFAAGMPLNRFVTIAWGKGGICAEGSVAATGDFVRRARDWLGGHGHSMPWVWVQECGERFGQHCHMLLQVAPELDNLFRPMPLRWVKAIVPSHYETGTLQCQKLAAARSAQNNPAAYEAQLQGKLHYMLKCAPERLEGPLSMIGWGMKPWGQSCRVYGKRAGVWQGWEGSGKPLSD